LPGFVLRETGSESAIFRAFAPVGAIEKSAVALASCRAVGFVRVFADLPGADLAACFETREGAPFIFPPGPVVVFGIADVDFKVAFLRCV
jgi:hypothetical protein